MRRFHSYGPVDCRYHFCVARKELIAQGVEQLIGVPEELGHYFTIWAPRQNVADEADKARNIASVSRYIYGI